MFTGSLSYTSGKLSAWLLHRKKQVCSAYLSGAGFYLDFLLAMKQRPLQQTWASFLFSYYMQLEPCPLPNGIGWLHPQVLPEVQQTMQAFFDRYFNDTTTRTLMLGINPGRFGAGVTGVNFTAPKQLTHPCNIPHPFGNQSELSAEFMYEMIAAFGGPAQFYKQVFIGSVCPLGFIKEGKNVNYYDDKELLLAVTPFILDAVTQLATFKVNRNKCICIGGGTNYKHLAAWNQHHQWFKEIVVVPHPRFVMQYKRKEKLRYIDMYLQALS